MSSESGTFPAVSGECVHTIWSYTDGPREGIADFHGKPYIYKCQFSEAHDDWTDLFWLMEIDQPLLGLATKKNLSWEMSQSTPIRPFQPIAPIMISWKPKSETDFSYSRSSQ
jgi:hypothetical protein